MNQTAIFAQVYFSSGYKLGEKNKSVKMGDLWHGDENFFFTLLSHTSM